MRRAVGDCRLVARTPAGRRLDGALARLVPTGLRRGRRDQRLRRGRLPGAGASARRSWRPHRRVGRRGIWTIQRASSRRTPPASRSTSEPGSGSSAGGSGSPSSAASGADAFLPRAPSPHLINLSFLIYLCAVYGNRGHARHSRPALDRPPVRLRDQGHRRPVDALLLGRELQPDLPGTASPRERGPDRRRGVSYRRPVPTRVQPYRGGTRGDLEAWLRGQRRTVELRDESLLRLFFADAIPREYGFLCSSRAASSVPRGHSRGFCGRSTPGRAKTRRSSASSCGGASPSTNGVRNGARNSCSGCAWTASVGLTEPSFRRIRPRAGMPGFLREGFLPLGVVLRRVAAVGHGSGRRDRAAIVALLVYANERRDRPRRAAGSPLPRFVAVQTVVGMLSRQRHGLPRHARRGERDLGSRVPRLRRGAPSTGRRPGLCLVPVPARFRESREFKRVYGVESVVWGLYFSAAARCGSASCSSAMSPASSSSSS